jgi:predicted Rossmann fold flavoprotein
VPSLFTFSISDKRLEGLAGVAVENAVLSLEDTPFSQTGPVLITHGGLSGPAVLKLSAWGARELSDRGYLAKLRIHWAGVSSEEVQVRFQEMRTIAGPKTVGGRSPLEIPQRLWERLVQSAGVGRERRWADLTAVERGRLMEELTGGIFEIRGKGAFKEEFVTAGGVPLNEVNFKTMESRRSPGLFFAGEILDIDGVTGGFNFQSAWTTGWQAGRAMAKEP